MREEISWEEFLLRIELMCAKVDNGVEFLGLYRAKGMPSVSATMTLNHNTLEDNTDSPELVTDFVRGEIAKKLVLQMKEKGIGELQCQ